MRRILTKYSIIAFAYMAVIYPVWVRMENLNWSSDITTLFPVFGLIAFSILWLHSMSGVFEPWLRARFDFDRFVHYTSLIILICIILHPLLLLISLNFSLNNLLLYGAWPVRLGVIGWFLLITYDIGKIFKKYNFFVRNWNKILLISTVGFLFIFFHSLKLGSDLQSGPLRIIWLFYGITAVIATIYTYGIKKFRSQF